jgi:hypothetical protein
MRPEKTPELWRNAESAFKRLAVDETVRAELDPVLTTLAQAFTGVQEKAMLSDPFLDVKLWALSQISFETIAVPGFRPFEFKNQKGSVEAMIAPVHDTALYNKVPFDTRIVKLNVDPNDSSHADLNGIVIYGIHVGFPVEDLDIESITTPQSRLLTVSHSGSASTLRRPLVGDISVFVVSNTKSGIHKAYSVEITDTETEPGFIESSGPVKRGSDWVQIRSHDGRYLRIQLLQGSTLQEVVEELNASVEVITASAKVGLSQKELDAIQSTLTGTNLNPQAPSKDT